MQIPPQDALKVLRHPGSHNIPITFQGHPTGPARAKFLGPGTAPSIRSLARTRPGPMASPSTQVWPGWCARTQVWLGPDPSRASSHSQGAPEEV